MSCESPLAPMRGSWDAPKERATRGKAGYDDRATATALPLQRDGHDPRAQGADLGEGGGGEVDDPVTAGEGTAVPDHNIDRTTVGGVGHLDDGPEGQGRAGAREAPDPVPTRQARLGVAVADERGLIRADELDLVPGGTDDLGGRQDGADQLPVMVRLAEDLLRQPVQARLRRGHDAELDLVRALDRLLERHLDVLALGGLGDPDDLDDGDARQGGRERRDDLVERADPEAHPLQEVAYRGGGGGQ